MQSGLAILAVIWLLFCLTNTAKHSRTRGISGQGYGAVQVIKSQLVAEVAGLDGEIVLYSNDPERIFLDGGRQPVYLSPQARPYRSSASLEVKEMGDFSSRFRSTKSQTYLAWFDPNDRTFLLSPQQLMDAGLNLKEISSVADGKLFQVTTVR